MNSENTHQVKLPINDLEGYLFFRDDKTVIGRGDGG